MKKYIENYEELKDKLYLLGKELTMTTTRIKGSVKFKKSIELLDEILDRKRSSSDKRGLGYDSSLNKTGLAKLNTMLSMKEEDGRSINSNKELQEHNTYN